MKVHYDIDQLPLFRNAVITIGAFDGVHMGHRQIIDRLKIQAQLINGETVIITFHPHPRKVVSSTILGLRLINTLNEKIELFRLLGINHVVVVTFSDAFANQAADEYVKNFLVKKFKPHTIIIGHDHRFGKDRTGNYLLLEKMAAEYNYQLQEIPKQVLDEIDISSTTIRQSLLAGKIEIADKLLGYDFFFTGIVVHGNKLGRKLGYPTANLKVVDEEKIIPGNGIYAVYAKPEGLNERLKAMMSIGIRPTINGKERTIEVNIFDFDEEIYDQHLKVYVKKYLREELKFDTLEKLVKQIDQDKIDSLQVL